MLGKIKLLFKALRAAYVAFVMVLKGWECNEWQQHWPDSYILKFSLHYLERNPYKKSPRHWCVSSGGVTWKREHASCFKAAKHSKKLKSQTRKAR